MRKSINRTTVIIVLAIFLTLSVGYALFSDTITIEGTATAQGNFDITATCQAGYSADLINIGFFESADQEQDGFVNDTCTVSDDTVTASVELEQPGSARSFTINMKNTGSIDAYLKLDSHLSGPIVFDEKFITTELTNLSTGEVTSKSFNFYDFYNGGTDIIDEEVNYYTKHFPNLDVFPFVIKLSDGSFTDGLYDLSTEEELDESLFYVDSNGKYYLKLAPNDTLIGIPIIVWNEGASAQGYSSKTTFTVPFDFIQKTSNMEIDPDAEPCLMGC